MCIVGYPLRRKKGKYVCVFCKKKYRKNKTEIKTYKGERRD